MAGVVIQVQQQADLFGHVFLVEAGQRARQDGNRGASKAYPYQGRYPIGVCQEVRGRGDSGRRKRERGGC